MTNSLRFWYYASLSTYCQNLEKNWGHWENLGESEGQTFNGPDQVSISVLWQLPVSAFFYFWWRGSINKISPIGGKKFMITKENSGKWQLFNERISLPDPRLYSRIYGDCNSSWCGIVYSLFILVMSIIFQCISNNRDFVKFISRKMTLSWKESVAQKTLLLVKMKKVLS